jgi:hypothetical protein
MKKLFVICVFAASTTMSCIQLTNKHTSRIYNLNTECLSDSAWKELDSLHSVTGIKDSVMVSKLAEFHKMPFSSTIYYFDGPAPELIAVAAHECVRYVYNPRISDGVLDGLSLELSDIEKERVGDKIQSILRKYQCATEKTHRYVQEWDK